MSNPAIGNQPNPAPGGDIQNSVAWGLWLASLVATPMELLLRRPGSAGHRYFGFTAFLGTLLPVMVCDAGVYDPTGRALPPSVSGLGSLVTTGLFVLLVLHWIASQRNKGREHSRYCGEAWLCRKPNAGLELMLGLAIGFALMPVSDGLAGVALFSAAANHISLGAITARHKLQVWNASDAEMSARIFARELEEFRRRG